MKKKIMIFMLLLSFLVGVGVPDQVKADNEEYTFEHWCSDNDFGCKASSSESWSDASKHFTEYSSNADYLVFNNSGKINLLVVEPTASTFTADYFYYFDNDIFSFKIIDDSNLYLKYNLYEYKLDGWAFLGGGSKQITSTGFKTYKVYLDTVLYFSSDIYADSSLTNIVFSKSALPYDFNLWCIDAGLSCTASSNESASVIPFFYEPDNYNYIVSKNLTASTTSGVYNLLMIQKSDGSHYPYHFKVSDIEYLGIAGSFSTVNVFTVRKFVYDTDGWKLVKRNDVKELPFDHADFTFDENTVFIYSDRDIYSDRAASSVWQPASTEYFNVDIPEPEITRVPVNPGTGSIGGQAKPGGIMEFLITTTKSVWTELFSVEVPVDGYLISGQQVVIYGALAAILWWLGSRLFGKK